MSAAAALSDVRSNPSESRGVHSKHPDLVRLNGNLPISALAEKIAHAHAQWPGQEVSTHVYFPSEPVNVINLKDFKLTAFPFVRIHDDAPAKKADPFATEAEDIAREFGLLDKIDEYFLQQRDKLAKFGALPRQWQELLLISVGGTGAEQYDDLYCALSGRPRIPAAMVRLFSAIDSRDAYRHRYKVTLPWAEKIIANPRSWNAVDAHDQAEARWINCLQFQKISLALVPRVEGLNYVPPDDLRLLTATDDGLLDEAERLRFERLGHAAHGAHFHPRDLDAHSIRRRLRRGVGRAAIWAGAILGLIGGPPNSGCPRYADDWTLSRWKDKKRKTQAFLDGHEALHPDGETRVSLADVAESATKARRSQWYAMTLGMEQRAKTLGLVPLFVSATLPAEWHSNPKFGENSYIAANSPVMAVQELQERWRRVRALARKHGIPLLGIRVIEPHGDACPHTHFLLWIFPKDVSGLKKCFRAHFPRVAENENEDKEEEEDKDDAALTCKEWKEGGAARPTSYVMKYIMKSLGNGNGDDSETDADDSDRLAAWAGHVGMRRMSLIGLLPGTVGRWRAAHRLLKTETIPDCPRARAVVHAMKRGRWGLVLALLGTMGEERRFVTWTESKVDRWGDKVSRTAGWAHAKTGQISLICRPVQWTIVETEAAGSNLKESEGVAVVLSSPRGAPANDNHGGINDEAAASSPRCWPPWRTLASFFPETQDEAHT